MLAKRRILDAALKTYLRIHWYLGARRLRAQARDPQAVQDQVLRDILRANRFTAFGREHGFSGITSHEDFRAAVPVCDFERLRPYIEAQHSGEPALSAEEPLCYLRTSGTTSQPKDIPLTASHLRALRRHQSLSVARQLALVPGAFDGSILTFTSPSQEGLLANGKPYGSASGVVAASTPSIVRDKFVLPASVLAISDSRIKYLLALRLALVSPHVSYVGAANSATLLTLAKLYRENEDALLKDLRNGGFFLAGRMPRHIMASLQDRLGPAPGRAADMERVCANTSLRRLRDLFPGVKLVITWTCASAGTAVKALKEELAPNTRILELGYMASEFRGTVTLGKRGGSGYPTLDTHYFEFAQRDEWDNGHRRFLSLSQIRKGVDYYIVVTTPSGLYRYFINDLVRVSGFWYNTPLLKFVQKGKGVTNITGEKLYESHVILAVNAALDEHTVCSRFYTLLADEARFQYTLYVEQALESQVSMSALASWVDAKLMALNVEFHSKRESARLQPVQGAWLRPGTFELLKHDCVAKGQREGQFKPPVLAYAREVDFDFGAHRLP
jgi:GH3 auxin-responsive promoter